MIKYIQSYQKQIMQYQSFFGELNTDLSKLSFTL